MNEVIQIVICDDDEAALKRLKRELQRYKEEKKVQFKIREYSNPELLYFDVTDGDPSEIYILDIDMPEIDGLDLSAEIHKKYPKAEVMVVSDYPEYGVKAVNADIRRFVTKDELRINVFSSLDDVFKIVKQNREDMSSRFWHSEKRIVEKEKILYIQKVGKYCDFTVDGEPELRERMSITDVFDKLASDTFIYIDRGIIASIPHIISTENAVALMSDKKRLPISRARVKEVRAAIHGYWGERQ